MQLCKLCKHALELEQSGGRRGGAEAEGVGGGQRWAEKGKGGHTMTPVTCWQEPPQLTPLPCEWLPSAYALPPHV